jgi:two-component system, NarL family, invasion response regulator UvrY
MSADRISILLVDDHAVVREGYRRLIEKQAGLNVVAEAADAASAYQAYKTAKPDVVVMDISMTGRGGIDAVRQIRQLDADARILMFTMHASASYAEQAFRAGAKGYVTKSSPPQLLIEAVRSVYAGRPALCPEICKVLAASRLAGEASAINDLSPREFEILRMILDAKSTDDIASAFNLSPKTVANYHYSIKSKLGVVSDIELVYFCMNHGLVTPLVSL